MTESTLTSPNRLIARIYRAGQAREIQPAPGSLRRILRTIAHVVAARDDQPANVFAVQIPLFHDVEIIGEPGLACWAGWEPVIRSLLLAEGYAVETIGAPRLPLPRPDLGRLQQLDPIDPVLLEWTRRHERALIRYSADRVDPVHLIAHIALAWPNHKLAVVATRIGEGRQIRDRLSSYGIAAVAVNSENMPPEVGPVAVCTPVGLSHLPVRVEWLDIVIVLDAHEITTKDGMESLCHAERARLFGLLEVGARPAPLERDFMTGLFGFRELVIPWHGYRERAGGECSSSVALD